VVGGVAGGHVGQNGLDAQADQGQPAVVGPLLLGLERRVAERDAGLGARPLGVPADRLIARSR
jgi:hypothetical protein